MRKTLVALVLLLPIAGFLTGFIIAGRAESQAPATTGDGRPAASPAAAIAQATGALPNLSDIAERAIGASVNISSTRYVQIDPFFQRYYGTDAVQPQTSLGSGVVVSADGYVLTNSHVIGNAADEIRVTFADNRELPARIVGTDDWTDLAVVKVDATGLQPLPWADSSQVRVAEWVLAIGNPFSFSQTVTLGIVSAVNREDPMSPRGFIQTDAAINPGNSGGALINSRGELVGINTLIYSETGGYQGIGFAIPANMARNVMDQLIRTGEIVRGSIGNLSYRLVDAETARIVGLPEARGARIFQMYRSDPAYRAGLLPNDIIVRFNGEAVRDPGHLQNLVASARIGSTATVDAVRPGRNGGAFTAEVPVARLRPARRRF
ncbi:MAG TPA: trypsin-like peptidase domain-containing protein [Vicinamibacterales bacterium]|nr:trypsin-like peptidase domain-containing protein [Vicinamibacterales bacterium]